MHFVFLKLAIFSATVSACLFAQVQDDFSDGDFSNNPRWAGDSALFRVNAALELQSNGANGTDIINLTTPHSQVADSEWRIRARYNTGPSNQNYCRFYLMSDQGNLEGPLNGYFIQLGEVGNNDGVDLFRQTGTAITQLIDGTPGTIASGFNLRIQVKRDINGLWSLAADFTGGTNFVAQGSATDNTHSVSTHLGVLVAHTASRRDQFFFDDVYAGDPIVDRTPPSFTGINVINANTLEAIFSEELARADAENPLHYSLDGGIGNPATATLQSPDSSKVLLQFAKNFSNNQTYTLTVSQLRDLAGNAMPAPQQRSFLFFIPDTPAPGDVILNEIMADPTPVQGQPDAEYVELYNRSFKSFDLQGWRYASRSTTATLPAYVLAPGAYVLLVRNTDLAKFANVPNKIGLTTWPSLLNEGTDLSLESGNLRLDSAAYRLAWYKDNVKANGGWSLERINPNPISCPQAGNWTASTDPSGGTPGALNSVFSLAPDLSPPRLLRVEALMPDTLLLSFNEPMDALSITQLQAYSLSDGSGNIALQSALPVAPDFQQLKLVTATSWQTGASYVLEVQGLTDCSGNVMPLQNQSFAFGAEPAPFDIVITEFLADFSPRTGLPETEFVEIYNRSNKVLRLDGWQFRDASTGANLPKADLLPGEYRIICASRDTAAFSLFGKLLPVSSLPGLNNDADELSLVNGSGQSMEYVNFDISWYSDSRKAEGGWTLERIDPDFTDCNQPGNWAESTDPSGGTPGRRNSRHGVYSDTRAPLLVQVFVPAPDSILLTFNEPLDASALRDVSHYTLSGIGQPLWAENPDTERRQLWLVFPGAMDSSQIYTLRIEGLPDCAGNIANIERQISWPRPLRKTGELLISEVLFNPYTGGRDFVELYNASDKTLDLRNLRIGNMVNGAIGTEVSLPAESEPLLPGEYLCLTTDTSLQIRTYLPVPGAKFLQLSSLPSYPDNEGECLIFTPGGITIDRFRYDDSYHHPSLRSVDGVSLERVSFELPAATPGNWQSAASSLRYATPGYENSQRVDLPQDSAQVFLPSSTFSPDGDGFEDVLTISYDLDFPAGNARISVFDASGRLVYMLAQNTLLDARAGAFFWDGRDEQGDGTAGVGMYVVLFEVTRADTGERKVWKLPCVLAKRF